MSSSASYSNLSGRLSTYDTGGKQYPYFTSGEFQSAHCVAFIPGLTAGLGTIPYAAKLSGHLESIGWQLVQFHWSGAYFGFGVGSLDEDVREMRDLADALQERGITDLVWMGNSTGCQDIAHFLSSFQHPIVKGGILQAPVSDREMWEHCYPPHALAEDAKAFREAMPEAKRMLESGRGKDIAHEDLCRRMGGKITWYRLYSLVAKGGDDDYFSSDLPSEPSSPGAAEHAHPLSTSFGKFSVPTLALWSEKDQFAWAGAQEPKARMTRWADHCPPGAKLSWAVVEGADHEVTGPEQQEDMIATITKWLGETFPRG